MPSLTRGNLKSAVDSVRATKWRSLMTMMGIIIGIVSVVTIVSIGEGIKQQIAGQVSTTRHDLITIRPGQLISRNASGSISGVQFLPGYTPTGSLMADDLSTIGRTSGVARSIPLSTVAGTISVDKREYRPGFVIGTEPDLPKILDQKIAYGDFFSENDSNENGAIIGSQVAKAAFGQDVPLGQSFDLLGQTFVVRGVFDNFKTAPLSLEADFNQAIFIPYQVSQDLTNNRATIYEILAQAAPQRPAAQTAAAITANLTESHGGQQDFTVIKAGETLGVTSNLLNLLTRLISGIAAISLLVGGIGIMNVMLVSVTERRQEIGIRKAVGATSRQIMNQFLIEASVLSLLGGIIGIILSLLINIVLRIVTDLQPVTSWQVIGLAAAISLIVGIVFGTAPALKAARKDPIDALRNE